MRGSCFTRLFSVCCLMAFHCPYTSLLPFSFIPAPHHPLLVTSNDSSFYCILFRSRQKQKRWCDNYSYCLPNRAGEFSTPPSPPSRVRETVRHLMGGWLCGWCGRGSSCFFFLMLSLFLFLLLHPASILDAACFIANVNMCCCCCFTLYSSKDTGSAKFPWLASSKTVVEILSSLLLTVYSYSPIWHIKKSIISISFIIILLIYYNS